MANDLIYPVEVRATPIANGGWEWYLLVARGRSGISVFTDKWQDPTEMFIKLLNVNRKED